MENNVTDVDIEYFKRYVNSGNKDLIFVRKSSTIIMFLFLPILGIILPSFWINSVALRIACLAIMASGIVCTIASDKWFPENRWCFFLAWLVIVSVGAVCFSIGVVLAYGISNILFFILITAHVVVAVLMLKNTVKRILNRLIPKDLSRKEERFYYLVSAGGIFLACVTIILITDGVSYEIKNMIFAACFMSASTVVWFRVRRLFQLYYAIKYDIDVENTWDTQKVYFRLHDEYQCPLLNDTIEERLCIKINYENENLLKPNKLKNVKKALNMTNDEIKQICINCKHYPVCRSQ